MSNIPEGLRYTSHDEWVKVEDGVVTIGITHFAQDQLGDIVGIELPDVDDTFEAGASVAELESVKAVAEIYTPYAGTITEVNEDLEDEPEQINETPYEAWLFRLKLDGNADTGATLDAAAYAAKLSG
jgi:glycine cleavage system H protein